MPHQEIGYECDFEVRTYEIDNHKRMTIPALVRLMQEAAMQNVIEMNLSVWDLEPKNISWVLMRQQLHLNRLPILGEKIRIQTYPAGFERLFTYRDYKVFDKEGLLLASSPSIWLLMDTRSRKMASIPPFIMAYRQQMPALEKCLPRPSGKIPTMERIDEVKHFEVNWHDLDFNQHLNNTLYIQWLLEPLPPDVLETGNLKLFDITYRAECQWQEHVRAEVQKLDNNSFLHRLTRVEDNKELATARTEWG